MQGSTYLRNEDRRLSQRRPFAKTVSYCVSGNTSSQMKSFDRNGSVVDISETGICFQTISPLSRGHIVRFDDAIKCSVGIVRWCEELDDVYRAGIELRTDLAATESNNEEVVEEAVPSAEFLAECSIVLYAATNKFNETLSAVETMCAAPDASQAAVSSMLSDAIEEMMLAAEDFENRVVDIKIIRDARKQFRRKTNPIISKSYCANRARVWPQGSQGDYKTLEILYKNTPLSEGIGYYLDRTMLDMPLGHAVRARIKKLEELLHEQLLWSKNPAIFNIACGACRELVGIVPELIEANAKIICVDSDNDALDYAQGRLADAGLRENIEFFKYNALRLFDYETSVEEFGTQDIIYSVGLFDYLPSDFLVKMFRTLYRMLNPNGIFMPAFKDAGRYKSQYYHWLVDWDGFLQRNEDEFKKILSDAGIPSSAITEVRDKTGIIVFYLITK